MILQALSNYYDRLRLIGTKGLPEPGWDLAPVAACLVIDEVGELLSIRSLMDTEGKKIKPMRMMTPQQPKRSGSKPAPAFLCENKGFIFGIYKTTEGSHYRINSSKEIHERILGNVDDAGARAVLSFLQNRIPGDCEHYGIDISPLEENGNLIFELDGDDCYLHERAAIRIAWEKYYLEQNEESEKGQCLVTGKTANIARLHPNFNGFGANKPTLVGYNQNSFTSYNKKQGMNAPVSEEATFKYSSALSFLLNSRKHTLNIHGDKIIFWADREAPLEESLVGMFFNPGVIIEDEEGIGEVKKLKSVFSELVKGEKPQNIEIDSSVVFNVLGISANKTRMIIRYYYRNTLGDLIERVSEHYSDIYIDGFKGDEYPSPYRIVREAVLKRDSQNIVPNSESELIQSILSGTAYPFGIYMSILNRIRAEAGGEPSKNNGYAISRERAGFIKGFINRNIRLMNKEREEMIKLALDENQKNSGYILGRLMALLEKAQKEALGKVNAGIVEKYMNTALATPQYVFPSLLAQSKNHISKISKSQHVETPYIDILIGRVVDMLPSGGFPATLGIEDQGRFVIGYYHQNQALYTKKNETEEE